MDTTGIKTMLYRNCAESMAHIYECMIYIKVQLIHAQPFKDD